MRRRDAIVGGAAFAAGMKMRRLLAQTAVSLNRAAVVIGVNKAGNLPILSAAVSGARSVADWLRSEGFEVKIHVDDEKPVRASDIFETVAGFVSRGNLDQLVVYFSGHGFLNAYSEYWMLSGAPENPNEAVSLIESTNLAAESAIPNVVFISDACRSTPDSLRASRVRGSLIFPILDVSTAVRCEIDQFFAALPGDPAHEVSVSQSAINFEGIYTTSFLSAFRAPTEAMVKIVNNVAVVPNRRLKAYLEADVPRRAEARSLRVRQVPDAKIQSGDTAYIGKAVTVRPSNAASSFQPNVRDVADITRRVLRRLSPRSTSINFRAWLQRQVSNA